MSDRAAVALALATAAGAVWARSLPLALGAATALAALLLRRPTLLCLGAALLASTLGARSWAGLEPPAPHRFEGVATLVTDPVEWSGGALRVELRLSGTGGRRVEAWARGGEASVLRSRLAGERVRVAGTVRPLPEELRSRLARRHIAARLGVTRVTPHDRGDRAARAANGLRRLLERGAAGLPDERRALFTGMVLGDDRAQSLVARDQFRAAGLTHLLAVSGQNVAFVLAVVSPLMRPLGLRGRLLVSLVAVAFFGLVTRWEPSVLRASAMAALALTASTLGRDVSSVRLLALAVTGLVLVDPLLVRSVGFLLSVGACLGIAMLARPLAAALPGPRWLALPLGVTAAAQVGVAPILVPVFGGVPLASLPANLLAVPAAGPVVAWGLTGGLLAGLTGGALAELVHLPTGLLVGWVAGVARWSARLPLATAGFPLLLALAVLALLAHRVRALRLGAVGLACVLAAWPVVGGPAAVDRRQVGGGPHLSHTAGVAVLVADGRARPALLLEDLRRLGVRRLDVVVMARGSAEARSLDPVLDHYRPRLLLTVPGQRAVAGGGRLCVTVETIEPRVRATVGRCTPPTS